MWWFTVALAAEPSWEESLERVTRAVVAIEVDHPRAFDGDTPYISQATGFVVADGWILTNRHVVTPGPVFARAVFFNQEAVDLVPVYRDPVHDFGLFRYDPADLEHIDPPELPLSPERAKVGLPIRVVGNDGGDQLQILDGTLAKLDRAAPEYGPYYNDFDTFYLQAAASTSGGSSGSPVVDIDGHVVAINAGGRSDTAAGYFLPLPRVVRAVERLTQGQPVPRGTLQTRVVHRTYDAIAALGVPQATLDAAREAAPTGTGLLVVADVLPGGPAFGRLEVGDVVVAVGDRVAPDHLALEGTLDEMIGREIRLEVVRGAEPLEVAVTPGDLHAISPDRLLEIGGAVLHPLSFHQARGMQTAVTGISIAYPGYLFDRVHRNSVITEVDGAPVTTLEALSETLAALPHGAAFEIRSYPRGQPHLANTTPITMDRRWFEQRLCVRDDTTGRWPCTTIAGAAGEAAPTPVTVPPFPTDDRILRKVSPSVAQLEVRIPVPIGGNQSAGDFGVALVVGEGLAVTDRQILPEALADVTLIVGGAARIPADVVALHPLHNLALLRFDPEAGRAAGLVPATLGERFTAGDDAVWVGETRNGPQRREVTVDAVVGLHLPIADPPRFLQTQLDTLELSPRPDHPGVLVDRKGRVGALWQRFSYTDGDDDRSWFAAMPVEPILDLLALAEGRSDARSLPWDLFAMTIDRAVQGGLGAAVAERLIAAAPERRQVLRVRRRIADSALGDVVQPGDLLVAIDGRVVTTYTDVEASLRGRDRVTLELWRNGATVAVDVAPEPLDPLDIDRVVLWSGLGLTEAYRAARMRGVPACAYVSTRDSGSPADRGKVAPRRCVVAVDGTPTPDLDALLAVDARLADGQRVRVDLLTLDGVREVRSVTIRRDFWPTVELRHADGRWTRTRR